jgi:hypothetical protein
MIEQCVFPLDGPKKCCYPDSRSTRITLFHDRTTDPATTLMLPERPFGVIENPYQRLSSGSVIP